MKVTFVCKAKSHFMSYKKHLNIPIPATQWGFSGTYLYFKVVQILVYLQFYFFEHEKP